MVCREYNADLGVYVSNDSLKGLVLLDQLHGTLWTDATDGVAVVTAKQYAEVYELNPSSMQVYQLQNQASMHRFMKHTLPIYHRTKQYAQVHEPLNQAVCTGL